MENSCSYWNKICWINNVLCSWFNLVVGTALKMWQFISSKNPLPFTSGMGQLCPVKCTSSRTKDILVMLANVDAGKGIWKRKWFQLSVITMGFKYQTCVKLLLLCPLLNPVHLSPTTAEGSHCIIINNKLHEVLPQCQCPPHHADRNAAGLSLSPWFSSSSIDTMYVNVSFIICSKICTSQTHHYHRIHTLQMINTFPY